MQSFFIIVITIIFLIILAAGAIRVYKVHVWHDKQLRIIKSDILRYNNRYVIPIEIVDASSEFLIFKVKILTPILSGKEVQYKLDTVSSSRINEGYDEKLCWAIRQVSSVAKKLVIEIRPQNKELEQKFNELKRLEELANSSDLYALQANLYRRAKEQVLNLLESGRKLDGECHKFVRETLIGEELMKYNPENIPDVSQVKLSLDYQCDQISSEYQRLKSEIQEYNNLKN
jgi:hypothetical protein